MKRKREDKTAVNDGERDCTQDFTIFGFDSAGRLVIRVSGILLGGIQLLVSHQCEELATRWGVGRSDSWIKSAGAHCLGTIDKHQWQLKHV